MRQDATALDNAGRRPEQRSRGVQSIDDVLEELLALYSARQFSAVRRS